MVASGTDTTFLDRLSQGEDICGLKLFRKFISDEHVKNALALLDGEDFPWDEKPMLYGYTLPQHAFHYQREAASVGTLSSNGLQFLESLCSDVETEFDCKISDVYCNRFRDPSHHIQWHKDTYGSHILVLSLGADRKVEWKCDANQTVRDVIPRSGDLYFMPLALNSTHMHQVCPAEPGDQGVRLSFVFFVDAPEYALEYHISTIDKVTGFFESMLASAT